MIKAILCVVDYDGIGRDTGLSTCGNDRWGFLRRGLEEGVKAKALARAFVRAKCKGRRKQREGKTRAKEGPKERERQGALRQGGQEGTL